MHQFWAASLRWSLSNRLLLLKRFQSTKAASENTKTLFSYGKGGHYFSDRIDPKESVRFSFMNKTFKMKSRNRLFRIFETNI